jgi:predicted MFS family arabinose efflux permease
MVNFFDIIKVIKENSNFTLLAIIFAIKQATLNGFAGFLSDILTPYGFSASQIAFVGLIYGISGIAGSIIVTIVLDKTHAYKNTLLTITATITLTLVLIILYVD